MANPAEAYAVRALFEAYQNDEIENIMPGDLEEGDILKADWFSLTKAEQKVYNKFSEAVYKFHQLDRVTGCYLNQENHYKVYGYYEDTTRDHIDSYVN